MIEIILLLFLFDFLRDLMCYWQVRMHRILYCVRSNGIVSATRLFQHLNADGFWTRKSVMWAQLVLADIIYWIEWDIEDNTFKLTDKGRKYVQRLKEQDEAQSE